MQTVRLHRAGCSFRMRHNFTDAIRLLDFEYICSFCGKICWFEPRYVFGIEYSLGEQIDISVIEIEIDVSTSQFLVFFLFHFVAWENLNYIIHL